MGHYPWESSEKPQHREGLGLCSTLCCWDDSERMIGIFIIIPFHILHSKTQCLPVQCPERGNRCAQVYATDFGWAKAFPMASRSKAHETLSLLFARDGDFFKLVHAIMPKRWYIVSFTRSSKILHVTWYCWSSFRSSKNCMSSDTVVAIYSLVKCCRKRNKKA